MGLTGLVGFADFANGLSRRNQCKQASAGRQWRAWHDEAMELFSYFRSSASWRVRIALALKGIPHEYRGVHLLRKEQLSDDYGALQPSHLVPLLRDGDVVLSQSLAILEYLDETHPAPALLPSTATDRAFARSLALDIACEIHPLNNLRVLRYLVNEMGVDEERKNQWIRHWLEEGLAVVEARVRARGQRFCHGEAPGLADCLLVPQLFNARRFEARVDHLPTLLRIDAECMALPAFADTHPSRCPDAE